MNIDSINQTDPLFGSYITKVLDTIGHLLGDRLISVKKNYYLK